MEILYLTSSPPLVGRFGGPSPTPVAGFGSAHRPGLRPVTPTAERLGVIAPKATSREDAYRRLPSQREGHDKPLWRSVSNVDLSEALLRCKNLKGFLLECRS